MYSKNHDDSNDEASCHKIITSEAVAATATETEPSRKTADETTPDQTSFH